MSDTATTTAYETIGGASAVRAFVDRFYDLMEGEPAYAALRALHAPDLGPMRESLAGFLTAWLGGPARDRQAGRRSALGTRNAPGCPTRPTARVAETWARGAYCG